MLILSLSIMVVTQNSSTLIDNINCIIPNIATSCKGGILRTSISDHYDIFCISRNENCLMIGDVLKSEVSVKTIYLLSTCNRVTNESWDLLNGDDLNDLT